MSSPSGLERAEGGGEATRHQVDQAVPGGNALVAHQPKVPLLGIAIEVEGGVPDHFLFRSACRLEELVCHRTWGNAACGSSWGLARPGHHR
jgi:hypothetical protein